MRSIQGIGVSPGLAQGPLVFFRKTRPVFSELPAGDCMTERARFLTAQSACIRALEELAAAHTGEAAALLETHAMLAEDEDFTACILSHIGDGCSAPRAVQLAGEQFSALFSAMDDPYMRERSADIDDVACRLMRCLTGVEDRPFVLTAPAILCADDLSPSETLSLDRSLLLGLITREGSATSHTAILARTMGIPAVCAPEGGPTEDWNDLSCCVDGETGQIVLSPDADFLSRWADRVTQQQAANALSQAVRGLKDETSDGRQIDIFCNIGSPEDIQAVLDNDGRGIGLFRSEFLFLDRQTPPGEEEQFSAYRRAAASMQGKSVVIRTMDLGADKHPRFLPPALEANPALGLRGVRLCLAQPDLFRTQLRAIYRASAFGNLSIMFPMIASAWEVRTCRQVCQQVMEELEREDIPFRRDIPIGIMIETPAAVFLAGELAREADFFCLGTNDLAQYTLACDREGSHLDAYRPARHPAILKAIRMTADAACAAGIPVSICGELASDEGLLSDFLDMGIGALSVSPARVLPLRAALRKL